MPVVSGTNDIEWRVSDDLVPYEEALAFMEERAAAIRAGTARECVWLLEHPPLFTAGTSADPAELFNPLGFPVYEAGRGGRLTPEEGLADVSKVLRPTDGVLIGMFPLDHTDIVGDNVRRIAALTA